MKRSIVLVFALVILCGCFYFSCNELIPKAMAMPYSNPLLGFSHNCTNTGIMLPSSFDPTVDTYLLTVASWINNVNLTPFYTDPSATVLINGSPVANGVKSTNIIMNNEPQLVNMEVRLGDSFYMNYKIFLQRRPSDKRTRVSSGFILDIYNKSNRTYIKADLVKVTYQYGNFSSYVNESNAIYNYVCDDNCIFYYGTIDQALRAVSAEEFIQKYYINGSNLYRIIYIEDKIVAVMPYSADY